MTYSHELLPNQRFVLYAEDDTDDIFLIRKSFEENKVTVGLVTVKDGVEALAFLEAHQDPLHRPCLIILDVNMPKLNGRDALVRIRSMEAFADTPILLFTTSSMELHRQFAKKYRADFMTKPLRDYQLELIIRKLEIPVTLKYKSDLPRT